MRSSGLPTVQLLLTEAVQPGNAGYVLCMQNAKDNENHRQTPPCKLPVGLLPS